MKLIVTDVGSEYLQVPNNSKVVENNGRIQQCKGCFQCWVKTPGKCILTDGYEDIGILLSRCSEVVIISQCVYGSVSPFIKNVIDRAISYMHPDFCYRQGFMHHKRRYDNVVKLTVYFYGDDVTDVEKETASQLVMANAVNFDGEVKQVIFLNSIEELRGTAL